MLTVVLYLIFVCFLSADRLIRAFLKINLQLTKPGCVKFSVFHNPTEVFRDWLGANSQQLWIRLVTRSAALSICDVSVAAAVALKMVCIIVAKKIHETFWGLTCDN